MGPEFWVGLAAVFVSGGAIGAAGTLLSQWIIRKLGDEPAAADGARELAQLRANVAELARQVRNLDARLDFQEQLLGGATPLTQPPPRIPAGSLEEAAAASTGEGDDGAAPPA